MEIIVALILLTIILISLSVHEFAHAAVANLYGDQTAKLAGRLTLNPIRHWDPIGTSLLAGLIILNAFGLNVPVFGWGKPVPINESNLENPRWSGLQVALAGPMSNFLLAGALALVVRYTSLSSHFDSVLAIAIQLNIFLMFFNLLPIPPLDGSSLLRLVIGDRMYFQMVMNPFWSFGLFFIAIFFLIDYVAVISSQLTNWLLGVVH